MFTHALTKREYSMYTSTVDLLDRLLQFITPFDPSRTIAKLGSRKAQRNARSSTRSRLYYMERVSGRQQFEDIVNPIQINIELSRTNDLRNDSELSIAYLHYRTGRLLSNRNSIFLTFYVWPLS